MSRGVTSKKEILQASRQLIQEQGWSAINIRAVATACGVSVGSIYNYFDSKSALLEATVESIWREIFHGSEETTPYQDTQACIIWMYERMAYGYKKYPGFFTHHALGFLQENTASGKRKMQQTWQHILNGLCRVLTQDEKIRSNAFTETFTAETFANVLFSLMLSALIRGDFNPSAVLEIVRRSLY